MNQYQVRVVVAFIVVFGHIAVFLVGFFILGIITEPFSTDTLQIVLTSCPVLASTAYAAFKYILEGETRAARGEPVEHAFAVQVIAIT